MSTQRSDYIQWHTPSPQLTELIPQHQGGTCPPKVHAGGWVARCVQSHSWHLHVERSPALQDWVCVLRIKWQPTPVFLSGESHGQRSPVGYSPRGRKKSDMTEQVTEHSGYESHFLFGSLMVWWWWCVTITSLTTRGQVSCSRPWQPVAITLGALISTNTRALSPEYWFVLVKGRAQASEHFKISQVSLLCSSKHGCQLILRTVHSHSVWIRWYLHLNEHFLKAYANNHQGATPPFSCDWQ